MPNLNSLFLSVFLISCGLLPKNNGLSVISAEKSFWVGGQDGVRGTHYFINLKCNEPQNYQIKEVVAEGKKLPFRVLNTDKGINIIAVYTEPRTPIGSKVAESNFILSQIDFKGMSSYILYSGKVSKNYKKLYIANFKQIDPNMFDNQDLKGKISKK